MFTKISLKIVGCFLGAKSLQNRKFWTKILLRLEKYIKVFYKILWCTLVQIFHQKSIDIKFYAYYLNKYIRVRNLLITSSTELKNHSPIREKNWERYPLRRMRGGKTGPSLVYQFGHTMCFFNKETNTKFTIIM